MSFTESVDELIATSPNPLLGKHHTWGRVRISDIAILLNGYPFESHHFTSDRHRGQPLIRIRDILAGETNTHYTGDFDESFLVREGDLLVGMDGDFNSVVWTGSRGLLNQRVCKIELRIGLVDKRFVAYCLPGYLSAINARTSSITVKHLSSRTVSQISIPLPPLSEQSRIADALDELLSDLDSGVAALERVKAKLALYRASVLKAAVEGTLTAEWREKHPHAESAGDLLRRFLVERRRLWEEEQLRKFKQAGGEQPKNWKAKYKEPVAPDTSGLAQLPESWCWATLDQIAGIAGGVTKGQKFSAADKTRMVPYLRVANVQQGFLDLSQIKTIRALDRDIEALKLVPGDVLFNEGGDRDKLGRGWIWEGQIAECVHQNHVFRARAVLPELQPKLLSWCGNSYGRRWFMKAGKQSVNLASINLNVLRCFPVALAPSVEQTAIVEAVEDQFLVIDHIDEDIETRLRTSRALRQSILRYAFTGRLVPQDPTDEPASELLKRIAAERESRANDVRPSRPRPARRPKRRNTPTRADVVETIL